MRLWRRALVVAAVVIIGVVAFQWYSRRAQERREASYQSTLRFYSEKFQPGLTRKALEDYLPAKSIGIRQQSGPADSFNTLSDLVQIGHYPSPWYCSSYTDYVDSTSQPEKRTITSRLIPMIPSAENDRHRSIVKMRGRDESI